MKCLKCFAGGINSDGKFQGKFSYFGERMEFQDDDHNQHIHSESCRVDSFACANGHAWDVKSYRPCPAAKCEWNATHRDVKTWTSQPSAADQRLAAAPRHPTPAEA